MAGEPERKSAERQSSEGPIKFKKGFSMFPPLHRIAPLLLELSMPTYYENNYSMAKKG